MANIRNSTYELRYLDELSQKHTLVHNIHPLIKLIVSLSYIVLAVSYGKYDIMGLLPLIIYPIIIFNLGDIPFLPIAKRTLIVLPLVLGLGIFNPIMDRNLVTLFGNFSLIGGWLSYITLIIKSLLTVVSALLLISTTGIEKIIQAMSQIKISKIIVMQFLLTYRYISVLLEEITNIWTAYSLRAPAQKGIHYQSWGPLLGQLLIRSYDRAQRIYNGMVLRGFNGDFYRLNNNKLLFKDITYGVLWILFFLLVRFYNIPMLLGSITTGV